jgi:hypothetical protein
LNFFNIYSIEVAEFMIRLAEDKAVGTYNAVGPSEK